MPGDNEHGCRVDLSDCDDEDHDLRFARRPQLRGVVSKVIDS